PDFITILAPPQGGKTTLARQLIDRLTHDHPDMLHVYMDFGCLGSRATEEAVSSYIPTAFEDRLAEVLDPDWYKADVREKIMAIIESPRPETFDELLEDYLRRLLPQLNT